MPIAAIPANIVANHKILWHNPLLMSTDSTLSRLVAFLDSGLLP